MNMTEYRHWAIGARLRLLTRKSPAVGRKIAKGKRVTLGDFIKDLARRKAKTS